MRLALPTALLWGALVAPLRAQSPGPATPADTQQTWTFQTDFGLVNTAGNTSTTTLNAGDAVSYASGPWTLGQTFVVVYGRTDGERSAENYVAGLRGDYRVTPELGLYLTGRWSRDPFAGLSRRFEEGTGLSLKALRTSHTELIFEGGAVLNQEWNVDGTTDNFASGRAGMRFRQYLDHKAYVRQVAEVLPNFLRSDDIRVNTETALVAPLSSHFALKASYVIKFDNQPEPGFKNIDRYLTSGLQVVF